jgi:hypothetical protein
MAFLAWTISALVFIEVRFIDSNNFRDIRMPAAQ